MATPAVSYSESIFSTAGLHGQRANLGATNLRSLVIITRNLHLFSNDEDFIRLTVQHILKVPPEEHVII